MNSGGKKPHFSRKEREKWGPRHSPSTQLDTEFLPRGFPNELLFCKTIEFERGCK